MKKNLYLLFALVLIRPLSGISQQSAVVSNGTIAARVTSTGQLFQPETNGDLPGLEFPSGSNLATIYSSNLWIGGMDDQMSLSMAAETYVSSQDWYPGPLMVGSAETSQAVMDMYDRVWSANSEDVNLHRIYFEAISNGDPDPFGGSYQIPQWMLEWPAHGDTKAGFDFNLAPFFDYNSNGYYDPDGGDYPMFCGDYCVFFIFNDNGGPHIQTQVPALGLEVHGMLYAFDSPSSVDVGHTLFLQYKLINRGSQTFTQTRLGVWSDFDMGNGQDDYCGTNVKRSSVFAFNGDNLDEAGPGTDGYGNDLPIQSMMILAGATMDADGLDNPLPDALYSTETNSYGNYGFGFNDNVIDNERLGLSGSIYYNNNTNPINGEPAMAADFMNYLRQQWLNGSSLEYGLNGVNTSAGTVSKYVYPGSTDPLFEGTSGIIASGWEESSAGNLPGDRRMIAACGPFTFTPGAIHELNIAFIVSQQSETTADQHFNFHDLREKSIRLFFQEELQDCNTELETVGVNPIEFVQDLVLYPNPANDLLYIEQKEVRSGRTFQIYSVDGRLVYSGLAQSLKQTVNVSMLGPGHYVFKILDESSVSIARFTVK
ncbi:MAG: T9SS type A sorting domain-containing protein [Flavobacteriales bacterium]|nr:T9SS type A sorting domain-containing protein [Flavobacteriales bacterium]